MFKAFLCKVENIQNIIKYYFPPNITRYLISSEFRKY